MLARGRCSVRRRCARANSPFDSTGPDEQVGTDRDAEVGRRPRQVPARHPCTLSLHFPVYILQMSALSIADAQTPLERARCGDHDAFAELIERYEAMVFSIAYHFFNDRTRAEEIAQDVFLQMFRSLGEIESDAHLLFWRPVILAWPARSPWPRWAMIPYLVLADLQNSVLAAILTFSDRVIYSAYEAVPRAQGFSALEDQAIAGVIMWVPGSLAFLLPVLWIVATMSPREPDRMATTAGVSADMKESKQG